MEKSMALIALEKFDKWTVLGSGIRGSFSDIVSGSVETLEKNFDRYSFSDGSSLRMYHSGKIFFTNA
jgi:hypothetical protein